MFVLLIATAICAEHADAAESSNAAAAEIEPTPAPQPNAPDATQGPQSNPPSSEADTPPNLNNLLPRYWQLEANSELRLGLDGQTPFAIVYSAPTKTITNGTVVIVPNVSSHADAPRTAILRQNWARLGWHAYSFSSPHFNPYELSQLDAEQYSIELNKQKQSLNRRLLDTLNQPEASDAVPVYIVCVAQSCDLITQTAEVKLSSFAGLVQLLPQFLPLRLHAKELTKKPRQINLLSYTVLPRHVSVHHFQFLRPHRLIQLLTVDLSDIELEQISETIHAWMKSPKIE